MYRIIVFVSCFLLIGCQTSYHVWHEDEPFGVHDAFDKVRDKSVTLLLIDGTEFDGCLTGLTRDTLQFQWDDLSVPIFVKVGQIHSVTTRPPRFLPTIGGVFAGATLGTLIGVGIEPEGHHGPFEIISPHDVAVTSGAIVGGLLGGITGSALSTPTEVIFSENENRDLQMTAEQRVAFTPSDVLERDGYFRVVVPDMILRLPMDQVEIERIGDRAIVHATQRTILSAPSGEPEESHPIPRIIYR